MENHNTQMYRCLSRLLEYPEAPAACARELLDAVKMEYPETEVDIRKFIHCADEFPVERWEEIYTATFDVNPACYAYAGYHLFGESFKRGEFLAKLKEKFREHGFDAGKELPDHIGTIFHYLSVADEGDALAEELVADCMIPALQQMIASFTEPDPKAENPYLPLLRAAERILIRQSPVIK